MQNPAFLINSCKNKEAVDLKSTFTTLLSSSQSEIIAWLKLLVDENPTLDKRADAFIFSFLELPWFNLDKEVTSEVTHFIVCLVSSHNYYTYYVLENLFKKLIPDSVPEKVEEIGNSFGDTEKLFKKIINAIAHIHQHVPRCHENLVNTAKNVMPFYTQHPHKHVIYARNLLNLTFQSHSLCRPLLEVVICSIVNFDVRISRDDLLEENDDTVFDMECGEFPVKSNNSCDVESSLDRLMELLFSYVHNICHGETSLSTFEVFKKCAYGSCAIDEKGFGCKCQGVFHNICKLKELYCDLKDIFFKVIFPVFNTSHVQFIMFYLFAIRPGLLPVFIETLRTNYFENPNNSRESRKSAMGYIGSLLARSNFILFSQVHACLEMVCTWCHCYLDAQEKLKVRNYEDVWIHTPFYYACQTLFYVFTFHHKEYLLNKERLALAKGLNLERLVSSYLNPLNYCSPALVSNFAVVARHYKIAYCYTVIEKNRRLKLPVAHSKNISQSIMEIMFPFDPFLLQRSKYFIDKHYKTFGGLPVEDSDSEMDTSPFGMSFNSL